MPTKKKPAAKTTKGTSKTRKGKDLTDQDLKAVSGGGTTISWHASTPGQKTIAENPTTSPAASRSIHFTK
jgi:hypothetical protein